MPRKCAVPSCNPRLRARVGGKASLFKVPRDSEKKKRWEQAVGIKLKLTQAICSHHFKEDELIKQKVYRDTDDNIIGVGFYKYMMLASDAVPSLHLLGFDQSNQSNMSGGDKSDFVEYDKENTSNRSRDGIDNNDSIILQMGEKGGDGATENVAQVSDNIQEKAARSVNENNPFFDSLVLQITLPLYWSRITPLNNLDCVIFACFFQDEHSLGASPYKEVCVSRSGNIVYSYKGQEIETNLDTRLTTLEVLERNIEYFDSWQEGDV